jgi:uncharacterized membrane protein
MDTKAHIRLWVAVFLISLCINPFVRRGESMERYVVSEIEATQAAFGPRIGGWIVDQADLLFRETPVKYAANVARAGTVTGEERRRHEKAMGDGAKVLIGVANGIFTGFLQSMYVLCLRFMILLIWFGVLAPVLIAAVVDGFGQRAIKRYTFGSMRPAAFSLLSMIIVPFVFAPLFYLSAPWSVDPSIVPVWVLVGCVPLSLLISNTQPVFGRH